MIVKGDKKHVKCIYLMRMRYRPRYFCHKIWTMADWL